ncbi:uncharacterized protein LOC129288253 [Prosopis cineraria]|uniref:uncharacterized protein LOC129288253 n=1 Tax=Prosopis cineraria TaxID=364024 RepID=UPI00240ED4FC|nr:uncharacterized protein LOC129288253 [Prosopis cineraria]
MQQCSQPNLPSFLCASYLRHRASSHSSSTVRARDPSCRDKSKRVSVCRHILNNFQFCPPYACFWIRHCHRVPLLPSFFFLQTSPCFVNQLLATLLRKPVEELKSAIAYQVSALQELRRLLSRFKFPPVEAAVKAGTILILAQCLAFGSLDEQFLEAAWCLVNIAAGNPEETRALLLSLMSTSKIGFT